MDFLNTIRNNKKIKEFIRFVIIGVIATAIHYGIYFLLGKFNLQYNIAYTLGYGISFIFNFFASNYFTFKTKPSTEKGVGFALAHAFNYALQMILLNTFIYLGISNLIAPIFVFAICIPTNFFIVRFALTKRVSNTSNLFKSIKGYFLGGFIAGIILFILLYGVKVLNFTNVDWLMNSGDLSQHYLGWEFFRDSAWTFPLGMIKGLGYPFGVAVSYMDSIPLFAIFFKLLNPILPKNFQYFGLFGLLCFGLQGGFTAIIVRKYVENFIIAIISCGFIVLSPIMLRRMFIHTALGAHWIILCAISIWVYRDYFKTLNSKVIVWSILSVITVLIHPYFIPMIMVILLGYLIDEFIEYKNIKTPVAIVISSLFAIVFTFWIIGGFTGESFESVGLGFFSMNINALVNPQGWSKFILKDLPLATGGQYEGFQYLGLGLIIMISIAVSIMIYKNIYLKKASKITIKEFLKNYGSIILVVIILFILSISNVITFNNKVVFSYKLPKFIESLLGIFRSTGRLFWPVTYGISLATLIYLGKNIKNRKIAVVILSIFLVFQVVDIGHVIKNTNKYYKSDIKFETTLKSDFWKDAGKVFKHVVILPPNTSTFGYFGKYATEYDMTLSTGYFARGPYTKIDTYAEDVIKNLKEGKAEEDTLYIIMEYRTLTDIIMSSPKDMYKAGKVDLYTVLYKNSNIDLKNYSEVKPYNYNQFEKISFDNYLDELFNLKDNVAMIYAIRDEAFDALTEEQQGKMKFIGFMEDVKGRYGWSCGGIVVKGKEDFNKEFFKSTPIQMVLNKGTKVGDFNLKRDVEVRSGGANYEVKHSHILLDGSQYSLDKRGVNIVLYDIKNDKILETATFDTHLNNEGYILRWK